MKKALIKILCLCVCICMVFVGCATQTVITSEIIEGDESESLVTTTSQEQSNVTTTSQEQSNVTTSSDANTSASSAPSNTTSNTTSQGGIDVPFSDTVNVYQNRDSFKYLGHAAMTANGLKFNATADSIEFTANCSGAIALTFNAVQVNTNTGFGVYFTVYIDGVRQDTRYHVNKQGKNTFTIANTLDEGLHTFEVYRQTESKYASQIYLESISLNGKLGTKPSDRDVYIEFIGDSITAGYGSLSDVVKMEVNTGDAPAKQDGTNTYAFLAGKKVGADICVTARTGIGLVRGYEPVVNGNKVSMYDFYDFYPDLTLSAKFNHTRTPDIYVINLGTNDLGNSVTSGEINGALTQLITKFLDTNPKAKIVLVGGMATSGLNDQLRSFAREIGGESIGVYVHITETSPNFHPHSYEHAKYADDLATLLQSIIDTL